MYILINNNIFHSIVNTKTYFFVIQFVIFIMNYM